MSLRASSVSVAWEYENPLQSVSRPGEIRLRPVSHPLEPGLLPGTVTRMVDGGALLKVEANTNGIDWVVLASRREVAALALAEGQKTVLEFPLTAIHLIHEAHSANAP